MGWHRAKAFPTILLLVLAFSLTSQSLASILYVSKVGSNIPPYATWETAANQVSIAAGWLSPGDTILVGAGTYIESDSIDVSGGATLVGVHKDSCELVLAATLYTLAYCSSGVLRVENLHMNSSAGKQYETGIYYSGGQPADSLVITSCKFSNIDNAVVSFARYCEALSSNFDECGHGHSPVCWVNWGSGNSRFENNLFVSNYESNSRNTYINLDNNWNADSSVIRNNVFRGSYQAIINYGLPGWMIVENNLFEGNDDLELRPDEYILANGTSVRIRNNLFRSENPSYSMGWQVRIAVYRETFIENNIFVGTLTGIGFQEEPAGELPAFLNIRNNDFFLNSPRPNIAKVYFFQDIDSIYCEDFSESTPQLFTLMRNNSCSSPMLVDSIDYFLQHGSPAIDEGASNILDLDGSRSDIGLHGGPCGSSYAYQELAPEQPRGLLGLVEDGRAHLSFLKNSEADLSHYLFFRSDNPNIPLDSQHVVGYAAGQIAGTYLDTTRIVFIDSSLVNRSELYYTVVAVDNALLSSKPAEPVQLNLTNVDEVPEGPLPSEFQLNQNYPNPFNATTAIVYSLPNIGAQPASVKLVIFNSIGQHVRVLVDQAQAPGRQVAYWDGKDDGGSAVASGVYFYSLKVSGVELVKKRKMVVVK